MAVEPSRSLAKCALPSNRCTIVAKQHVKPIHRNRGTTAHNPTVNAAAVANVALGKARIAGSKFATRDRVGSNDQIQA